MLIRFMCTALACATLALAGVTAARAEVPTGGLYVTTLPAGADVWVDGTYVGRSPVFIDALPAGRHSITLTKSGWIVREIDTDVVAGKIALSSTKLDPGSRTPNGQANGTLLLRGLTRGTKIMIDGVGFGGDTQKSIQLSIGTHRLTIETARGKTTRTFSILAETTTQIIVQQLPADVSRSAVVAPVDDYLPLHSYSLEGKKIVVRFAGHVVVAYLGQTTVRYDGATIAYDGAPEVIGRKLYLPLELLERLASEASKEGGR